MLINCPACSFRFDLPLARLDAAGTMLRCPHCGHDWIEARAIEPVREPAHRLPTVIEGGFEPDGEIRRLVEATREAEEGFAARRRQRRRKAMGWAMLGACLIAPMAAAYALPEPVVRAAPATMKAFALLGREVNIYGLDLRHVEVQHLLVEGSRMIAIKGEIVNLSGRERKIPWLRFGLQDEHGREVYSWLLDTAARPLRVGENTSFVSRVASPPEGSQTLQIRFAHSEEIGSTAVHE
jgi:predicted Zn finger-like uncharacterized protein